jgi:hypothetical protein
MADDSQYTLDLIREAERRRASYLMSEVMPAVDGLLLSVDRMGEDSVRQQLEGVRAALSTVAETLFP